ncbi:hypothetical protein HanPI659440_Chr09g0347521 [Helianthus annuus]|nr:hypothetical protein HanPI659440_Chr09g0347521 [Helianthus annuus]
MRDLIFFKWYMKDLGKKGQISCCFWFYPGLEAFSMSMQVHFISVNKVFILFSTWICLKDGLGWCTLRFLCHTGTTQVAG